MRTACGVKNYMKEHHHSYRRNCKVASITAMIFFHLIYASLSHRPLRIKRETLVKEAEVPPYKVM